MASKKRAIAKRKKDGAPSPVVVVRRVRRSIEKVTNGCEELMEEGAELAREIDRATDFAKRVGTFLGRCAGAVAAKKDGGGR